MFEKKSKKILLYHYLIISPFLFTIMTIFAYCQPHSLSADYTFPIVFLFSSLSFNGRPTKLRLPVIIMTFGNVFGTDLTFSNFLTSFSPGIDHDPHVFSMIIWLMFIHFFMFHSSHDHVAKRSHYHVMIFSTLQYHSTDIVEWRFGFMPVRTSTGYRLLVSRWSGYPYLSHTCGVPEYDVIIDADQLPISAVLGSLPISHFAYSAPCFRYPRSVHYRRSTTQL